MYKGKIDKLINEINKIARLKRISYKLENIYEEYDEYIEDYYFMEWFRMSQDGITQIEEINNMIELFEQILEEIEIAIYNAEDKVDIICDSILAYNKNELGNYISDFELYNNKYIKDTIMNFIENNMYEIDEDYLFLELEKLLEGGVGQNEKN
jgi:DNA repair ATPase RecN